MKIRKALEKAKQARQRQPQPGLPMIPKSEENKPLDEWQAPVYSKSMHVELNNKTVIKNRCVCIEPTSPEIDCYKVLRTQIQMLTRHRGWKTIMITSPRPSEGKTLTSINLALTFSKVYNQTVLLVDGDLRNQSIHKVLGFRSSLGLIDNLAKNRPLEEVIIWPGIEKLTIISGGPTIQNSTELLGSPRMKNLIQEMKSRYNDRYVLFDVSPLLVGADALALAPSIDCIIMVVDEGSTSTQDVKKALDMIPKEKFLGFVLNRQEAALTKRYYGYYR